MEGKHGANWGDNWTDAKAWRDRPWLKDDDRITKTVGADTHVLGLEFEDDTWGSATSASHTGNNAGFSASDFDWTGKYFDASWELGDAPMHFSEIQTEVIPYIDPATGLAADIAIGATASAAVHSGYRWFEGINTALNLGTSEVNDPAKLKCHTCDIQREMRWVGTQFTLFDPTDATNVVKNDENLWSICHAALTQRSCEYSAGTCFVEERRTWGYITQVRAGCKQAQACYMQKYQNFLVKAGRQCWPGDSAGMIDQIASRPYDVMADNWITNIISGGLTDGVAAQGSSFGGGTGTAPAFGGAPFDNTYTDMPSGGMNPHGFFKTGGATTGNAQFFNKHDHVSTGYFNGMMPTSKCYQCCNTEHNCNFQWQPHTEEDWEHAYVWKHTAAGGVNAVPAEETPRAATRLDTFTQVNTG